MLRAVSLFHFYITGPRLVRLHATPAHNYQPNLCEAGSQAVLSLIGTGWSFARFIAPLAIPILMWRVYMYGTLADSLRNWTTYVLFIGACYLGASVCCGIGRYLNVDYRLFARVASDLNAVERLQLFDHTPMLTKPIFHATTSRSIALPETPSLLTQAPHYWLVNFLVHAIGRPMLYPGSTGLMQNLMGAAIAEGRASLVERSGGSRRFIRTVENNRLDTMFIDRRGSGANKGDQLVICCEGNAGFYELGLLRTPLKAGYSVIGWNHPGFGESEGAPWPTQEIHAVDAVMQYAISHLGFDEEQIIIYAWSIGAFSGTWGAVLYPKVKGLILDATFDDLLPLAEPRFPEITAPLVRYAVRTYLDLHIASVLQDFHGPVMLTRRRQDEIIVTGEPGDYRTNRANDLLLSLLSSRYPTVMLGDAVKEVSRWLMADEGSRAEMEESADSDLEVKLLSTLCEIIRKKREVSSGEMSALFPLHELNASDKERRSVAFLLAKLHIREINMTHCEPLSASAFPSVLPWQCGTVSETTNFPVIR